VITRTGCSALYQIQCNSL